MNVKDAAQEIRDRVTMDQVLGLYGYKARHGFICCPFHGEKEPSLKIYDKDGGWHCFGCGRGGSVIDFVMEHEGCNFRTAVTAIDKAMGFGLLDPRENPFEADRQKRIQSALDGFVAAVIGLCDLKLFAIEHEQKMNYQKMIALEEIRDGNCEKLTAADWDFLLSYKDNDDYNEYMKEKTVEFKEEVAAWRRRYRRKL